MELLERHIVDTIKEWQMKIGYQEEKMGLYYPDVSLISLLGLDENTDGKQLDQALEEFCSEVQERLGDIKVTNKDGRYCLEVPARGCRYVAECVPDSELLRGLLDILEKKQNDMEPVRRLFMEYAAAKGGSCAEKDLEHEGLGRVFYFEQEEIDPYVYCVEQDDFGITYHRFDRPDYEKMAGGDHHSH